MIDIFNTFNTSIITKAFLLIHRFFFKCNISIEVTSFRFRRTYCVCLAGLWDPISLRGSGDLRVKISKNALINVVLVRLSPRHWPKVGRGTAKQQIKKASKSLFEGLQKPVPRIDVSTNLLQKCFDTNETFYSFEKKLFKENLTANLVRRDHERKMYEINCVIIGYVNNLSDYFSNWFIQKHQ